jgi:DnaK suppressor protein
MARTRKTVLKRARERLLQMKRDLHREIEAAVREGRESGKADGMDAYDLATEERDREINMILSDRERGKLQAIENAVERIDEGSYGICDSCESDIAEARLEAMPFTRLCVSCQADREKQEKLTRRVEADRYSRRITPGDVEDDYS